MRMGMARAMETGVGKYRILSLGVKMEKKGDVTERSRESAETNITPQKINFFLIDSLL